MLAADRAAQTKASNQELDRSRVKSNRHMRDSRQWKAAAERTTAELQVVRKRLVKRTDALEALQADLEETRQALKDTRAEKRKAEKERQNLRCQWDWLLAKVSFKERARLRRLSATPLRNRDRSWGQGQ